MAGYGTEKMDSYIIEVGRSRLSNFNLGLRDGKLGMSDMKKYISNSEYKRGYDEGVRKSQARANAYRKKREQGPYAQKK